MGRFKLGIAVAGVVVTLLGVVAFTTMRSDGGAGHATTAASGVSEDATVPVATTKAPSAPATQPATTVKPAQSATNAPATTKAPAATAAPSVTVPAQPTAQDIQKVIAGITAEVLAPANTSANTQPLTKEQVEAKVREQLKQLGITF
jgi:hypothetical protein